MSFFLTDLYYVKFDALKSFHHKNGRRVKKVKRAPAKGAFGKGGAK